VLYHVCTDRSGASPWSAAPIVSAMLANGIDPTLHVYHAYYLCQQNTICTPWRDEALIILNQTLRAPYESLPGYRDGINQRRTHSPYALWNVGTNGKVSAPSPQVFAASPAALPRELASLSSLWTSSSLSSLPSSSSDGASILKANAIFGPNRRGSPVGGGILLSRTSFSVDPTTVQSPTSLWHWQAADRGVNLWERQTLIKSMTCVLEGRIWRPKRTVSPEAARNPNQDKFDVDDSSDDDIDAYYYDNGEEPSIRSLPPLPQLQQRKEKKEKKERLAAAAASR
jgi:hypothetical protein